MSEFDIFPDAEAMISQLLRDALSGEGIGVYSSIPNNPSYPFVVIKRIGGLPANRHNLDHASLQFDVFGSNKGEAHDLAQRIRTIVFEAEGSNLPRGWLSGVQDELGLLFLPDLDVSPPIDRYIIGLGVFCHS